MQQTSVGISGFAAYFPPLRVDLRSWCQWTGSPWEKISGIVGDGFRMLPPGQSVYTMAATAALRLIEQYEVDPRDVGFLALGTESSTDNSAGAIIVRGMLDAALTERGQPPLSRHCEVPELKHACLGAVYALKSGLRKLALEPAGRVGIVIAADIAKYDLGSSGEPTQGAGAVAMLIERDPRLLEVDIVNAGTASAYRAIDFRRPHLAGRSAMPRDTPVFNGKYSVSCYLDEALHALRDMLGKLDREPADYYRGLECVFMHRPYQHMPTVSWGLSYLVGLASNGAAGRAELAAHCERARLDTACVIDEMRSASDLLALTAETDLDRSPYPLSMQLLKSFRDHPVHREMVEGKMRRGAAAMREVGNVYCASLPAWIAAGMEELAGEEDNLAGRSMLAVGYGSGDAAEAIPLCVVPGWTEAAGRIGFAAALAPHRDLARGEYWQLHQGDMPPGLDEPRSGEFMIDSIGCHEDARSANTGVEFYRYVP